MQGMNLNMNKFINENVVPKGPFEREGSHKFINAIKSGDTEVVRHMLDKNKYFVYDYDVVN